MKNFNEAQIRLLCLILANGDIQNARDNYTWITTGLMPIKDRVKNPDPVS